MNNCKCGAKIKSESDSCIPCFAADRQDKRKAAPKSILNESEMRNQDILNYPAPGYFGEVRLEVLVQ